MSPRGSAWTDLMSGLALLARGGNNAVAPFHCEHDTLYVHADPMSFTGVEIRQLGEWGFLVDDIEHCFYSCRFGSA